MAADSPRTRPTSSLSVDRPSSSRQTDTEEEPLKKDKAYRRYASTVERVLSLFDSSLQEWADYIAVLGRLLKALQSHPLDVTVIPHKKVIAKRLAQCLNPSLPSGVHQKALEIYGFIFGLIGEQALSRDLPIYLPGLCPVLTFASLSVRPLFLSLVENHLTKVHPSMLRPALKAVILALLPGLEDETSEDFERVLSILDQFKKVASSDQDQQESRSQGEYFWQCFFLASIASISRRQGVLAFLVRRLPRLGDAGRPSNPTSTDDSKDASPSNGTLPLSIEAVLYPEPGLLVRCFVTGLTDDQMLVQRGFLDLLVTCLPMHSHIFRNRVSRADQRLLVSAAIDVVIRRDMSLNRRLWAWILGPDDGKEDKENAASSPTGMAKDAPTQGSSRTPSPTQYFEKYGFGIFVSSLREMLGRRHQLPADRARPFRICLSLMDRWEVGMLILPQIFMSAVDSLRQYEKQSASKEHFTEVLRSASGFFDVVESGLICGELRNQLESAIQVSSISIEERAEYFAVVNFTVKHVNMREEEMISVHLPLFILSIMTLLESRLGGSGTTTQEPNGTGAFLLSTTFELLELLISMVPARVFARDHADGNTLSRDPDAFSKPPSGSDIYRTIGHFYTMGRDDLDYSDPPFSTSQVGELLLLESTRLVSNYLRGSSEDGGSEASISFLVTLLSRYSLATNHAPDLFTVFHQRLESTSQPRDTLVPFSILSTLVTAVVLLRKREALQLQPFITSRQMTQLLTNLVRQLWGYLSPSNIKYLIETVHCLWQLQSAMTSTDHTIEACICALMVQTGEDDRNTTARADAARKISLLWTHSLQSQSKMTEQYREKRPSIIDNTPQSQITTARSKYKMMLARPVFLLLDALSEEGTERFLIVRNWLQSLGGIEKLLRLLAGDILSFQFLCNRETKGVDKSITTSQNDMDELDLCVYYFETLLNVSKWCSNDVWSSMATDLAGEEDQLESRLLLQCGFQPDATLQSFFAELCMHTVRITQAGGPPETAPTYSRLRRTSLSMLQLLLGNPYASALTELHLEHSLINALMVSVSDDDSFAQIPILDTLFTALNLQSTTNAQGDNEHRNSKETMRSPRQSLTLDRKGNDTRRNVHPPPPQLAKCLLAGFSSRSTQPILDSWVNFLAACLPILAETVFQILIPFVECLCREVNHAFNDLKSIFGGLQTGEVLTPDARINALLAGLETILAFAHGCLWDNQPQVSGTKTTEQPGFFGNMVSGVFNSETPQTRSAAANSRLSFLLALQDTVRICFDIWSWDLDDSVLEARQMHSKASFVHVFTRTRNKARRLLERLFAVEPLECAEILISVWCQSLDAPTPKIADSVINLLHVLDGSRPKVTVSAVFIAINSRTNPNTLQPVRKSTLTADLTETDLVTFLSEYARSIDDDAMDEIWKDCMSFLRDVLANPFPHRQIIPKLLEFTAVLGEKMANTSFGDQRMRRDLSDLFLRLLTATFTIRPMGFSQETNTRDKSPSGVREPEGKKRAKFPQTDDVVAILASIVPKFSKIFVEVERSLAAAQIISTSVVGPAFRSKLFPDHISSSTLDLLHELTRLPNAQKFWKKDVADAFNHPRFFSSPSPLVKEHWLRLVRQWAMGDNDRIPELLTRITQPTSAGIMFGVGATSARLDADRKTQLNLRRVALLILASPQDTSMVNVPSIEEKIEELLAATPASSPSSATRAEVYMLLRALILRISPVHLFSIWSVISAELQAVLASALPDDPSKVYNDPSLLQACKLLDTLVVVAPEEFQLHEWLFITDSIDAVYRPPRRRSVALVDEISETLGKTSSAPTSGPPAGDEMERGGSLRRPLLSMTSRPPTSRDELMSNILQPFFSQLSIHAFESTYSGSSPDYEACSDALLEDLFDEGTIGRE